MNHRVLIIVPAFNAAAALPELVERMTPYVNKADILVIDDGSSDGTGMTAEGLGCRVESFPRNRGKGAALRAGFAFARRQGYEAVITIDADLQHPPECLPLFAERYGAADIVIGTRPIRRPTMPWVRCLTNNVTSLIVSILGRTRVRDSQSGYRMIRLASLRRLRLASERYDTESEILLQAGFLGLSTAPVAIPALYVGSASSIRPLPDTGRFIRQLWRRLWY